MEAAHIYLQHSAYLTMYKDATCLMTANLVLIIKEEKGFGKKSLFECIITTFCYTN